ncbi:MULTISPECIES: helicase-related protein [Sphingobium]|uniref:Superfamily II DNA/RNA helicase, SNF2 family n=1 Tax=Sphingobium fuliginis (strain ATCC 27551) TaxID=336203 RepID=A0A292ZAD9_SPHSA|nr:MULTISPECIES: helicase-related protein [Sphingobium]WDA34550.1 helicase-related protein [Sphingobium sp. YC-XJ3]GAY20447.1 superfamily II DNA/RNA helicase, SNF2 family [Sphingobium fuliginis]
MKIEELAQGQSLSGVEPSEVVTVVAIVPLGEGSVQLIYRTPDGSMKERMLGRVDEELIELATTERPFSFDGDGDAFKLTCEAKRIDLAFLFDPMMAVHSSNVDPLPHQITAVYESLLPRQPLRFVLADDPGAGKTIMAGLYIRELIMRADAHRILIVAPGSLVEQWRDELYEKFGLEFHVYSSLMEQTSPSGNPFDDYARLIVRLDQLSRNEELQEKLCAPGWDLAVFDEAHKLSAHYFGSKLEKTGRFRFAEKLGAHVRHLLLMTATPHNGKEEDFQLFLSLLDSDRFYGKFRDGVHKVDASDLMRRMVKEELVKFDGTPLFPERKAYTVNYELSPIEAALYEAVTEYVQTEMGKADQLEGARKGSVGFALTALQRRLASSPEAIFQSLKRRRERLENRLRDEKLGIKGRQAKAETYPGIPEDDDDLSAEEQEDLEESLIDDATAAKTVVELEAEIVILKGLEDQAKVVVASGQDRKWDELSKILQDHPEMRDASGRQRKIIIFSEHRDTLNYLQARIAGVLGNPDAIVSIHGGTHRDERRRLQALFRSDPDVRVLVATDAAGEGVNLQNANLMVNYDLPWNPNRLEQRFGRIHRIGQTEVCHLWNLVAKETREGAVYHRLLEKLRVESDALKGRVFDILGEVFEETSLKDLLLQAIRYGDQPDVRARLSQKIDQALDHDHLKTLLDRNALDQTTISPERLFAVKEEMEKAEARRLQPFFVRAFFLKALDTLGGTAHPREAGRYEVTHVPAAIRERDRRITGRNRREHEPVLRRYSRVCFDRNTIQPLDKPGMERALLMHPGHPLMLTLSDMILEQHANLLRQGAVLVDPSDEGLDPALLFLLTHEIKSGDGSVLSKRLQFVRVAPDGTAQFAGWAPHLDLEPLDEAERSLLSGVIDAPWLSSGQEARALSLAATTLVPEHYNEVAQRRIDHVEKTINAVHERLSKEIAFWQDRWVKLKEDGEAGKDVRLNLQNVERTLGDLQSRLESRKKELQSMRHVVNGTPVVLGAALIVPGGLMNKLRGDEPIDPAAATFAADASARSRIEQLAMQAVTKAEEARGCRVVDVSAAKCGWDLSSYPPAVEGRQLDPRHIEVKGRVKGASTVTVSRNEMLYAFNQGDKFVLAIALVDSDDSIDGPHYVRNPFDREPGWGVASINFNLSDLLARAEAQ